MHMTTQTVSAQRPTPLSLAPTRFERALAWGALVILAAVLLALARGRAHWTDVPTLVWLHIATIVVSLVLTPVLLLRPRGVRRHRQLGYIWVGAMSATAALSFGIYGKGGWSAIHLLSAFTLVQAPLAAWHAHRHRLVAHRTTIQMLVLGALLIAGFFTFPFGRMLGRWLTG